MSESGPNTTHPLEISEEPCSESQPNQAHPMEISEEPGSSVASGSSMSNAVKYTYSSEFMQALSTFTSCIVCLELPPTEMYQCQLGHLMCDACLSHILVEATLHRERAKCPGCRVTISRHDIQRNRVVEEMMLEFETPCKFCKKNVPNKIMKAHSEDECKKKPSCCLYYSLGCPWFGPIDAQDSHAEMCEFATMPGREILKRQKALGPTKTDILLQDLCLTLNQRTVLTVDLNLMLQAVGEVAFYESSRFTAFDRTFKVKLSPVLTSQHPLYYHLYQHCKTEPPLHIKYGILPGPFTDISIDPVIESFTFSGDNRITPLHNLKTTYTNSIRLLAEALSVRMRLLLSSGFDWIIPTNSGST